MATDASQLVEQLQLQPHPEGGWYRETWRAQAADSHGRVSGTAILFLLKTGESSHWHTVDAEEMWIWQSGDPLHLRIAARDDCAAETLTLGPDIAAGHILQGLVPTDAWQAARSAPPKTSAAGYSLVSCVVVPGFDFSGFTLAAPGWSPGG